MALLSVYLQAQICRPLKVILSQMQKVVSGRKADYRHFNRVDEIGLLMRLVNQSGLNLNSLVGDVSAQINGIRDISLRITEGGESLQNVQKKRLRTCTRLPPRLRRLPAR
jgi:aerotaxis receptor